jgi:hypothetical protein
MSHFAGGIMAHRVFWMAMVIALLVAGCRPGENDMESALNVILVEEGLNEFFDVVDVDKQEQTEIDKTNYQVTAKVTYKFKTSLQSLATAGQQELNNIIVQVKTEAKNEAGYFSEIIAQPTVGPMVDEFNSQFKNTFLKFGNFKEGDKVSLSGKFLMSKKDKNWVATIL